MNNIKPLGNRVLIKRSKAKTTKGGIILPETAKEKPKEGIVLNIGPGKINEDGHLEQMHVKINDTVLFSSYSGTEVKNQENNDEEYLIMSEDDILGILSN